MRNLVIFGAGPSHGNPVSLTYPVVEIDDMVVRSTILNTPDPAFDLSGPDRARHVLVQVEAFSCNYRDKGFILRLQQFPASRFAPIGSEFVGTVLEAGPGVTSVRVGDRVIGQNHFTGAGLDGEGVPEGISTNRASREYQLLHENKLVRIPATMPIDQAAAFSLGAQTAYSMVRKLAPEPGSNVLVTSATANTSLFAIAALRQHDVTIYATTTSRDFDHRLREAGVDHIVHVGGEAGSFRESAALGELAREIGWFQCVVDPYYDLHMEKAVTLLGPYGRYTSCGLVSQTPGAARRADVKPVDFEILMLHVMTKNLSILGNCIGRREDLERALADHEAGRLRCAVDSVFSGEDTAGFLQRTYADRGRFGKVVFRYAPARA